uniref:Uncharacterized protein n=1 Tax=Panagrolaimus davidi TaxID=227884 RepID=A0A914PMY8_9BILA
MSEQKTSLKSYDGGDQGFLNSYYNDLKFSPMFNPLNLSSKEHHRSLRLSAIYNYDIGMYYLSGRMLIEPKIIHYTLVFLKPWIWWTYPMFDLNWKWLEVRGKMEKIHGREDDIISNILIETIVMVSIFGAYLITCLRAPQMTSECSTNVRNCEKRFIGFLMIGFSFLISFALTPEQMWPTHAWALFTFNMATFLSFFLAFYSKHRLMTDLSFSSFLQAALAVIGPILLAWNCLYFIENLGRRYLCGILFIAGFILGLNEIIKLILFSKNCRQFRYLSLRKQ